MVAFQSRSFFLAHPVYRYNENITFREIALFLSILFVVNLTKKVKILFFNSSRTFSPRGRKFWITLHKRYPMKAGRTQEEDKPMDAVSVFTTGNYHRQLLLRYGSHPMPTRGQPSTSINHHTYMHYTASSTLRS